MDKIITFNVGWAMASYCEVWWKRIVIDIWTKTDFSPVLNFLLPYAKNQNWEKSRTKEHENKYHIDQLVISHPHRDHVADIENFYTYFYPEFVTTPNDNDWMENDESINWDLVFWSNTPDMAVKFFKDNLIKWRKPPLKSIVPQFELYYIPPKKIEKHTPISDYTNNTSLVCIINLQWRKIMLPWDMMESWMKWMLNNRIVNIIPNSKTETIFKNAIKKINTLIAPHHGLESAFCVDALNEMRDNLRLVILPEKPTTEDDKRQIHPRYYNSEFGSWIDIITFEDWTSKKQWTVKTSMWHIILTGTTTIKVTDDNNLLKVFVSL